MREASPSFQFYPKDFLADVHVAAMDHESVGIYMRLLCYAWIEVGVPSDLTALAMLVGVEAFARCWPQIQPCFALNETGDRLVNNRQELERAKQRVNREHGRSAAF